MVSLSFKNYCKILLGLHYKLPFPRAVKHQILAEKQIFSRILKIKRIQKSDEKKCFNPIILFGIKKSWLLSQAASPLYVPGVLFLSEEVFQRLPAYYQWRENLFAQDRISSYTYQMFSR